MLSVKPGVAIIGRTPHGVRGLKFRPQPDHGHRTGSHPSRGAWIEMRRTQARPLPYASHPSRGAWIEMGSATSWTCTSSASHPSRGAWIEILSTSSPADSATGRTPHGVRGLKCRGRCLDGCRGRSHPSRGAWIEIPGRLAVLARLTSRTPHGVRGLKCAGHVDRGRGSRSHPSRGAWIEISPRSSG